jgi:hypothetical protein
VNPAVAFKVPEITGSDWTFTITVVEYATPETKAR